VMFYKLRNGSFSHCLKFRAAKVMKQWQIKD
jgi:hypothetical protein